MRGMCRNTRKDNKYESNDSNYFLKFCVHLFIYKYIYRYIYIYICIYIHKHIVRNKRIAFLALVKQIATYEGL